MEQLYDSAGLIFDMIRSLPLLPLSTPAFEVARSSARIRNEGRCYLKSMQLEALGSVPPLVPLKSPRL